MKLGIVFAFKKPRVVFKAYSICTSRAHYSYLDEVRHGVLAHCFRVYVGYNVPYVPVLWPLGGERKKKERERRGDVS